MKRLAVVIFFLFAVAQGQQKFGNATYVEQIDPFTDEDKSRVVIWADEQPYFGLQNALVWRCATEGYELYVTTDEFLNNDPIDVRHRFDDKEASDWRKWSNSTTGTGAFAYTSLKTVFTTEAVRSRTVVIGLQDYEGTPHIYTFALNGLQQALERLGCVTYPGTDKPITAVYEETIRISDQSISEVYETVINFLEGSTYTQGLNVIYAEGLTISFSQEGGTVVLALNGTDGLLIELIDAAF